MGRGTPGSRRRVLIALLLAIRTAAPDDASAKLQEGRALLLEARERRASRDFEAAVSACERAIALLEESGAPAKERMRALHELGEAQLEGGNAEEAAKTRSKLLDRLRAEHGGDHPNIRATLSNLAAALSEAGRLAEALPYEEEALSMARRLHGEEHGEVAACMQNLAQTLGGLGRFDEAVALQQEALSMNRRLHPGDPIAVADGLNNLAHLLGEQGREEEALPLREEALATYRRLFPGDHRAVARGLNNLGMALAALGRDSEAFSLLTEALGMERRLWGPEHPRIAGALNNLALLLFERGRYEEALPRFEEALALLTRSIAGDHPQIATVLGNIGSALGELGRHGEALERLEAALDMRRRLFPEDHPDVAISLSNVAGTLRSLGRYGEALSVDEQALAIYRRLFPGDHPHVARLLNNLSSTLNSLGRPKEALPLAEEGLAMRRRIHAADHPDVANSLHEVGFTLGELGRLPEQLPLYEDALAMRRRIHAGDHPDVAVSLANLARCHCDLGRPADALPFDLEALEMRRRIFPAGHEAVASSLNNVAATLDELGRPADALRLWEEALALRRKNFPGGHPEVATSLGNVATALASAGRNAEARDRLEEALAMNRRLLPPDHPSIAQGLANLGFVLEALGLGKEAVDAWREAASIGRRTGWPDRHGAIAELGRAALRSGDLAGAESLLAEAVEQIEMRRADARALESDEGTRYSAAVREGHDPYPDLVETRIRSGRVPDALGALERGRARTMLDLLARGGVDPGAQAFDRATREGDGETLRRLDAAQRGVAGAEGELLLRRTELERARSGDDRERVRAAAAAEREASGALERARRAWLLAVREALPETSPLPARGIADLLRSGERMLYYGLGPETSYLFLLRPEEGEIAVFPLPAGLDAIAGDASAFAEALSVAGDLPAKREKGRRLFEAIVPPEVWEEIRAAKRVYIVPHGPLHRVPFEALVTREGRWWTESGPPAAYAASGSVLAWLRGRRREGGDGPALVAAGDPLFAGSAEPWPERGVLILEAEPGSQAMALGIRPGDVVVAYGEREVHDLESLRAAMAATPPDRESVPVRTVREAETRVVLARPGRLGVTLADGPPSVAGPAFVAGGTVAGVLRGEAFRGTALAPLPGTRREVEAIRAAFGDGAATVTLLGAAATEARLFDAAKGARHLHIATHGWTDETRRASLSLLVLARPRLPVPGDDGYLTLADLFERWRGRLMGARLVVLSACESQRGRLARDEGMLALPWGFCYAGAPAVIASLWRVEDESTAALMADFYRRLLSPGAPEPAEALHEARKARLLADPDPFRWGAFVLLGAG